MVAKKLPTVAVVSCATDFGSSSWEPAVLRHAQRTLEQIGGVQLVSSDQVEQERNLLRHTPPYSEMQLALIARRLRADAAVDILCVLKAQRKKGMELIACARWVNASLGICTRGGIGKRGIKDASTFANSPLPHTTLLSAVEDAIKEMMRYQPIRSDVQLQGRKGTIHLMGGKRVGWKKKMHVAIMRRVYNRERARYEWQLLGRAKITRVETFYAVARPIGKRFSTRNPDKAIALFIPPPEFAKLLTKMQSSR
ncbi:MAG TPA: hypothetical protein EYP10_11275 [Armatimonadetes bacterium]|nr:hypothetical protein [Armatimonadota bacterium]